MKALLKLQTFSVEELDIVIKAVFFHGTERPQFTRTTTYNLICFNPPRADADKPKNVVVREKTAMNSRASVGLLLALFTIPVAMYLFWFQDDNPRILGARTTDSLAGARDDEHAVNGESKRPDSTPGNERANRDVHGKIHGTRQADQIDGSDLEVAGDSSISESSRLMLTFVPEKSAWRGGVQYQWRGGAGIRPMIRYSVGGSSGSGNEPEWFADSMIANTASPESLERLQKALLPLGVIRVESLGSVNTDWQLYVSPENAEEYLELKEKIRSSGHFSSVDHDLIMKNGNLTNDQFISLQYSLGNAKTGAIVRAPTGGYVGVNQVENSNTRASAAWETKRDCSTVRVGVIDSGIEFTHPDLASNINTNLSRNFVPESVLQMNCTTRTVPNNVPNTVDAAKFGDENGHGTHVAGTIGAIGNNSVGVAGVCWKAEIVSLRAMNSCGAGSTASILAALQYAAANNIRVVNMSLGGNATAADIAPGSTYYNAIDRVTQAGGLVIAAAGNERVNISTNLVVPASINNPGVITVASHNAANAISPFSNFSNTAVHISAPGEGILSTFPMSRTPTLALSLRQNASTFNVEEKFKIAAALIPNNGYNFLDGTSMAAPHVAGVVALVWSLDPSRSAQAIKNIVLGTADTVSGFSGQVIGGRRVNLQRAVGSIGGYALGVDQAGGVSQFEASVAKGEPVLIKFSSMLSLSLQGAKLRLGTTEIGTCSEVDKTCVGKIPENLAAVSENTSIPLSVVATASTIPAGSVRVFTLSEANGLFAQNNMSSSCRVVVEGKTISSFKSPNMTSCRNICRALISGMKRPIGECRFAEQMETLQVGSCNASSN